MLKRYKNAILMLLKEGEKNGIVGCDNIHKKKGFYTQVEFAERIGVSYSTVNRWENGKMNPNVSAMKRLKAYCDALNIEFGNVEKHG